MTKEERDWNRKVQSRNNVKNPTKAQLLDWAAENANAARMGYNFPTVIDKWKDAHNQTRTLTRRLY